MDSYEKLMERMGTLPFSSPRTESGIEIELLKKHFTPEEAEIACNLTGMPETAASVAQRIGMDAKALGESLDAMVKKRSIFKVFTEEPLYSLPASLIFGIQDWQVGKISADEVGLWHQYWEEGGARELFTSKTPIARVVPVARSISGEMTVFSYEEVEKVIDGAKTISITDCICRSMHKLVGKGCDAPDKGMCIHFDTYSDFYTNNKMARRATKEEAREVLARARDAGLVHCTLNVKSGPMFICNCCGCCCVTLKAITKLNFPNAIAKSNFIAEVSPDACTGCGTCVERCNVKALELVNDVAHLKTERCIGCGVCETSCKFGAISLRRKSVLAEIPADVPEFFAKHAAGRERK